MRPVICLSLPRWIGQIGCERRPRRPRPGVSTMNRTARSMTVWGCLLGVMLTGCHRDAAPDAAVSQAAETSKSSTDGTVVAARVYAAQCATCHGADGRGDGEAAYLLYPKPRDFTAGVFRFKSTAGDQSPTTTDVSRVIREGVPRTAMPAFDGVLTGDQIDALAAHVVALGGRPASPPEAAMAMAPLPGAGEGEGATPQLIHEGKLVYKAMGCAACHGETGRGDGPSSLALRDSQGWPLPPADFTRGVFKAGRRPEDLYRTIMVGVAGTPMPGFADVQRLGLKVEGVSPDTDQVWAMTAYIGSLAESSEPAGTASGAKLAATTVEDGLLNDVAAAGWADVPATAVSLQSLWQRKASARSVQVRVARAGNRVGLLLEWSDATCDVMADTVERFGDASAVMFSLSLQVPALTMATQGNGGEASPLVNLWQWKASRQINADQSRLHDVGLSADTSRGAPSDWYAFKSGDPVVGPIVEHDPTFVPAWREGNPHADPALLSRSVLESNAAGFGTTTLQLPAEQAVAGKAAWVDGRWRVLMVRDLKPGGPRDVNLASAQPIPLAFAVWDGHAGDRNGTKLISGWHWLVLNPDRDTRP